MIEDQPLTISSTATNRPITQKPDSGHWLRIINPKIMEIIPPNKGQAQFYGSIH